MDFHGSNNQHAAHRWHPFPAKFPPRLPGYFIERLTEPGDVALDPMFGSGTTILEALRLGRRAVGSDIDPLARLIAEAQLSRLHPVLALQTGAAVVDIARHRYLFEPRRLEATLRERFAGKTRAFVDYWFRPAQQLELTALLQAIESGAPPEVHTFLHMVFSSTIIAKSGGVSLARDLAHTRPHRVPDKKPKSAFDELAKRLKLALASAGQAKHSPEARILARSAENRLRRHYRLRIVSSRDERQQCVAPPAGRPWSGTVGHCPQSRHRAGNE